MSSKQLALSLFGGIGLILIGAGLGATYMRSRLTTEQTEILASEDTGLLQSEETEQ